VGVGGGVWSFGWRWVFVGERVGDFVFLFFEGGLSWGGGGVFFWVVFWEFFFFCWGGWGFDGVLGIFLGGLGWGLLGGWLSFFGLGFWVGGVLGWVFVC